MKIYLLMAVCLSFSLTTLAAESLVQNPIQVSHDPYTEPVDYHSTEVEPHAFSYGDTIVSAFQVGRSHGAGATNIGWASSQDAGQTWHYGFLDKTTVISGGKYDHVSDVYVAYDAKHNIWMLSVLAPYDKPLLLARSFDGGLTWKEPLELEDTSDGTSVICDNSQSSRFYGTCYVFYDWGANIGVSTDGGNTWTKKQKTGIDLESFPGLLPDGTIYIGTDSLSFSRDGAKTWSQAFSVGGPAKRAGIPIRGDILTSLTSDTGGRTYFVRTDCGFQKDCTVNDILFGTSDDLQTWNNVTPIPLKKENYFNPAIAVDPNTEGANAHIGVMYYYADSGNDLFVGITTSKDGGKTWSNGLTLAGPMKISWLPPSNPVGDYMGISFSRGVVFPFFAFAPTAPDPFYHESIYTVPVTP